MSKKKDMNTENSNYQVLVCNISWSTKTYSSAALKANHGELPAQISLDVPQSVLDQAKKSKSNFNDIIEQFVYNLLAKKFGKEVNRCQIWLPLED